jgi:hypothetical protein
MCPWRYEHAFLSKIFTQFPDTLTVVNVDKVQICCLIYLKAIIIAPISRRYRALLTWYALPLNFPCAPCVFPHLLMNLALKTIQVFKWKPPQTRIMDDPNQSQASLCKLCSHDLEDPRMLSCCEHTFCYRCLHCYIRGCEAAKKKPAKEKSSKKKEEKKEEKERRFPCPECSKEATAGSDLQCTLKKNFWAQNMLDMKRKTAELESLSQAISSIRSHSSSAGNSPTPSTSPLHRDDSAPGSPRPLSQGGMHLQPMSHQDSPHSGSKPRASSVSNGVTRESARPRISSDSTTMRAVAGVATGNFSQLFDLSCSRHQ